MRKISVDFLLTAIGGSGRQHLVLDLKTFSESVHLVATQTLADAAAAAKQSALFDAIVREHSGMSIGELISELSKSRTFRGILRQISLDVFCREIAKRMAKPANLADVAVAVGPRAWPVTPAVRPATPPAQTEASELQKKIVATLKNHQGAQTASQLINMLKNQEGFVGLERTTIRKLIDRAVAADLVGTTGAAPNYLYYVAPKPR